MRRDLRECAIRGVLPVLVRRVHREGCIHRILSPLPARHRVVVGGGHRVDAGEERGGVAVRSLGAQRSARQRHLPPLRDECARQVARDLRRSPAGIEQQAHRHRVTVACQAVQRSPWDDPGPLRRRRAQPDSGSSRRRIARRLSRAMRVSEASSWRMQRQGRQRPEDVAIANRIAVAAIQASEEEAHAREVPDRADEHDLGGTLDRLHERQRADCVLSRVDGPRLADQRDVVPPLPLRGHLVGLGRPAVRRPAGEDHRSRGRLCRNRLGSADRGPADRADPMLARLPDLVVAENDDDAVRRVVRPRRPPVAHRHLEQLSHPLLRHSPAAREVLRSTRDDFGSSPMPTNTLPDHARAAGGSVGARPVTLR